MLALDKRTKNYLKAALLLLVLVVLTGCARNLDSSGNLIADRAINSSTPWDLSNGIFNFILVIPLAKLILFITDIFGNVAAGVIVVTILVNIIILPVMIKSTVSTQKMQLLQPEVQKIQNKYRGRRDQASQMRMQAEMNELYKKNNVSMFGSMTTLVTLPIMIAMWQSVQRIEILYTTSLLGINLGSIPMGQITSGNFAYLALILLVGITQFFGMQMTNIMMKRKKSYRETSQTKQMRMTQNIMSVFIIYMAAIMPSAMSLYWITTNVINIIRTWYIYEHHVEEKKEVEPELPDYVKKDIDKKD